MKRSFSCWPNAVEWWRSSDLTPNVGKWRVEMMGGPSEQSPSGWFMMSQSLVYDWFHVQVEGPTLGWNVVARNRIDIEWYGYWIVDYRKCQPLSCRDSELTHCCILTAGWGGASKGPAESSLPMFRSIQKTSLCMFPALAVKITLYHSKHMVAGNPHIWWADHLQMEKKHMFQLRMIDSGRENDQCLAHQRCQAHPIALGVPGNEPGSRWSRLVASGQQPAEDFVWSNFVSSGPNNPRKRVYTNTIR